MTFAWKACVRTRRTALLILLTLVTCTTDRTRRGYLRENAARFDAPPARPAIVVPGFGVSRLFDPLTGRYVWGTAHAMVQRRYQDDLDLQSGERDRLVPRGFVGSRGPINIAWQLTEALRKYGGYTRDRDVYAFAYDWRRSALHNARELANFIDGVRRAHGGVKWTAAMAQCQSAARPAAATRCSSAMVIRESSVIRMCIAR